MDAVLFDMDGVLVDSERYWQEFEAEFVLPITEGDPDREEFTGMNYREIYDYLAETYGTAVDREEFVSRYDERAETVYGERVALMDGAPALFDDLRAAGALVGIVSSSPPDWIGIVTDRFDLGPLDLVRSAEDIDDAGKPEPHVYERAAADLGLSPGDCVVVEDSPNGILSATRAGAYCVGYRAEHNVESDLSRADVVVEGPEELRRALLGAGAPFASRE